MSNEPRRLAGANLELTVPDSLAARWDVLICHSNEGTAHRAAFAALGLCWPRLRRKLPYSGDAVKYGGQVCDLLLKEGAKYTEALKAAYEALNLCAEGLPGVEGAEGFSEPPGGPAGPASGG